MPVYSLTGDVLYMTQQEKELTNEGLASLFNDNFQLAVTAIRLAQNEVVAGHEVNLHKVLHQLKQHPNLYSFETRLNMPVIETHE